MRILHTVEFYEPSRGGAQEVVKQISERLAKRGHDVTVATSAMSSRKSCVINGVKIEEFHITGNLVKGVKGEIERYQTFLRTANFDILLNYAAQTWTTDLTFPLLDQIPAKKVIAPLGYSRLGTQRYAKYFKKLPEYLRKYDRIVYTSPNYQDKSFGDLHGLASRSVGIPNGAASEEFSSEPIGFRERYGITTKYMLLNVSNHYLEKGHTFVLKAFRKLSVDDATLVIIGEKPYQHGWYSCYPLCVLSGFMNAKIKVLRHVPRHWVVSAYEEADLFLFGSELECAPLVMYEAFASRTPFVTRHVGNVRDHKEVVKIVHTPDEMAAVARELLEAESERASLSQRAYELWSRQHTWERVVEKYEELYTAVLSQSSPES